MFSYLFTKGFMRSLRIKNHKTPRVYLLLVCFFVFRFRFRACFISIQIFSFYFLSFFYLYSYFSFLFFPLLLPHTFPQRQVIASPHENFFPSLQSEAKTACDVCSASGRMRAIGMLMLNASLDACHDTGVKDNISRSRPPQPTLSNSPHLTSTPTYLHTYPNLSSKPSDFTHTPTHPQTPPTSHTPNHPLTPPTSYKPQHTLLHTYPNPLFTCPSVRPPPRSTPPTFPVPLSACDCTSTHT